MADLAEPTRTHGKLDLESGLEPEATGNGVTSLPVPLALRMSGAARMSAQQFFELCQQNELYRIERRATGEVVIMPPAGPPSSERNGELFFQLCGWAKQDGTGVPYESSAGFTLPNGAERSPDVSWIRKERLAALTPEQRQGFWPICPDFVAEIRSPTDTLPALQEKMEEYRDNGARLGWLIDPRPHHIYVYRPDQPVELLDDPAAVSGDSVLPGFVLDAQAVFKSTF